MHTYYFSAIGSLDVSFQPELADTIIVFFANAATDHPKATRHWRNSCVHTVSCSDFEYYGDQKPWALVT
jgi:hypothetical protein